MPLDAISPLIQDLRSSLSSRSAYKSSEAKANSPEGTAAGKSSDAARDIISRYDVHQITPRDLANLLHELSDAGAIDDRQLRDLAALRLELDRQHADADEPIDLRDWVAQQLKDVESELSRVDLNPDRGGRQEQLARRDQLRSQLEWVDRLAIVQNGDQVNTQV